MNRDKVIEVIAKAVETSLGNARILAEHQAQNEPEAYTAIQALTDAGYAIVPVEPTEAMLEGGGAKNLRRGIYKAMIEAGKVKL